MHLYSSFYLVLLVFSINIGWSDNATISCTKDTQCRVNSRICADCINVNKNVTLYPSCTTAICINNQCGTLGVCSLQLTGTCKTDGDCIRNFLCETCRQYKAPSCVTARCFNNKCALIQPCTITLQH